MNFVCLRSLFFGFVLFCHLFFSSSCSTYRTLCVKELSSNGKWRKTKYLNLIREYQSRERMNVSSGCTLQEVYMKREARQLKHNNCNAWLMKRNVYDKHSSLLVNSWSSSPRVSKYDWNNFRPLSTLVVSKCSEDLNTSSQKTYHWKVYQTIGRQLFLLVIVLPSFFQAFRTTSCLLWLRSSFLYQRKQSCITDFRSNPFHSISQIYFHNGYQVLIWF